MKTEQFSGSQVLWGGAVSNCFLLHPGNVYMYVYMSYDYNSLYIIYIYITWSNLISFHIFLESCKLNNGYQWNLIQQCELESLNMGILILNIICKKGRTRSWVMRVVWPLVMTTRPLASEMIPPGAFPMQEDLWAATSSLPRAQMKSPRFWKRNVFMVESLSPWLTCHSPYISWVIQPTYRNYTIVFDPRKIWGTHTDVPPGRWSLARVAP